MSATKKPKRFIGPVRPKMSSAPSRAMTSKPAYRTGGYGAGSGKEMKFVDLASNIVNLNSSTTNVQLLATIAQGASQSQRIGRKVQLKSVQIKGRVYASTTTTISGCRYLVVYDKQANKAAPVWTDIMDTATYDAMKRDDNKDRFIILRDVITQVIGNSTTPSTGQESQTVDLFIKINMPTEFAAVGTGAIGDIVAGSLWLISIGEITAGTAAAFLEFTSRTRYQDM